MWLLVTLNDVYQLIGTLLGIAMMLLPFVTMLGPTDGYLGPLPKDKR